MSQDSQNLTPVRDVDELEPLWQRSHEKPVFVFKHSLTCPISSAAFRRFRSFVESHDGDAEYALVEIQNARPVSAAVTERAGIRHESPQAILLRAGEVAWHASHGAIRESALETALADG